ncbi:BadF/BadG/BcrA/BcrD ATPase family protein [Isoptericola sp. AK164]|uniref:N-acetylglucosamine kinase n=1 Tax=Isoptericola sp. AK164 TaxID=3024246 RepID=UPI00241838A8|nr:BadF/BadG/BcrA/BcrD ATPase family protein [Isoptericola sp. AK164]
MGVDLGGSGSRVALNRGDDGPREELVGPPIAVGETGATVPGLLQHLLREAATRWPVELSQVTGVGVGATGLASLVESPSAVAEQVRTALDAPVVVAIDAVAAHLGALAGAEGAVVALGTGAVAIGRGADGRWRRVDGWGHLLGDRGGGAWLGRRGLEAALRAYDGVDDAGSALLAAGRRRLGEPVTWPAQLYPRADRAAVLAGFAPDVVAAAATGDEAARALLTEAGREAADSVLAALDPETTPRVALTGGLARAGGDLSAGFSARVAQRRPDVVVRPPAGDPLDGAMHLARRAARGTIVTQEGFVWD